MARYNNVQVQDQLLRPDEVISLTDIQNVEHNQETNEENSEEHHTETTDENNIQNGLTTRIVDDGQTHKKPGEEHFLDLFRDPLLRKSTFIIIPML